MTYRVKSSESAARKIAASGGLRTLDSLTDLHRLSLIRHTPRSGRTPVPIGITVYYAGMLRHVQQLSTGNEDGIAYSGISADSLLHSLRAAMAGSDPLPGV